MPNPIDTRPGSRGLDSSLVRLIAAAAAIAIALVGLWQSGVAFQSRGGEVSTANGDGQTITLQPAEASIATPGVSGLTVGLREGDLAPDFEFSTFDGERMRLSDLRGQTVLLNFWATWCAPCRIEMPDLENLLRAHAADGLVVIGINNGEKFGTANKYLQQTEVKLSAYGYDPTRQIVRRYAVEGMPTSYFIDAQGVIRRVVPGQMSAKLMETVLQDALPKAPGAN